MLDWIMSKVKQEAFKLKGVKLSDAETKAIVEEIVINNFPICLDKYLKGERWKLENYFISLPEFVFLLYCREIIEMAFYSEEEAKEELRKVNRFYPKSICYLIKVKVQDFKNPQNARSTSSR